jgi:hypothetical protein
MLHRLASGRVGLVIRVFVRKVGDRPARNPLHLDLIYGPEYRNLIRRPSPLRLREGREVHSVVGVAPSTLRSGV